jgi:2,3-bisphosphoglycerate-independent phosphoglycerate mutase
MRQDLSSDMIIGKPKTSHTTNYIPINIAADPANFPYKLARTQGGLADVAPTICHIMGLPKPPQMTGTSMLTAK